MKAIVTDTNRNLMVFFTASVAIHVVTILFIQLPASVTPVAITPREITTLNISLISPSARKQPDTKMNAKMVKREADSVMQGSAAKEPLQAKMSKIRPEKTVRSQKSTAVSNNRSMVSNMESRLYVSSEYVNLLTNVRPELSQTSKLLTQVTHSLLTTQTVDTQQEPDRQLQENTQMVVQRLTIAFSEHFSYPRMAQRNGWQGIVKLALRIEPNGQLSRIRVVSTSGFPVLDQAALDTLNRIATLQGVKHWLNGAHFDTVLPVEYKLLDG